MTKKKEIEIIEEHSEPIEVETNLTLEDLVFELASLTPEHRRLVIKTARRFAKAYKSIEEIQEKMRKQKQIEEMENEL